MTKYTDPSAADYILPKADIRLKVEAGIKQKKDLAIIINKQQAP